MGSNFMICPEYCLSESYSLNGADLLEHGNGIPDALLADDLALFVPLHEGHAPGGHFLAGGGNTEKIPRQLRFPGPLEGPAPVVAGGIEDSENVVLDVGILVLEHPEKPHDLAQAG